MLLTNRVELGIEGKHTNSNVEVNTRWPTRHSFTFSLQANSAPNSPCALQEPHKCLLTSGCVCVCGWVTAVKRQRTSPRTLVRRWLGVQFKEHGAPRRIFWEHAPWSDFKTLVRHHSLVTNALDSVTNKWFDAPVWHEFSNSQSTGMGCAHSNT